MLYCVKAKRSYERAHREAERTMDLYKKADADIHLSRADVEKVTVLASFIICCYSMKENVFKEFFTYVQGAV